jgi:hypothetical protein
MKVLMDERQVAILLVSSRIGLQELSPCGCMID